MGDAILGLRQVAQHADDLTRATAFYRDVVGLRHIVTFDPPGLVFFDLGDGTRLMLEGAAPSALLYLAVDDIEAVTARLLAAGVAFEDQPHMIHHDEDGGAFGIAGVEEWMDFFRDSEGNLVGLAEGRRR
jgi:methylmalonyl-CoA/ethylmalonyl-CoA epimerase